MVDFNSLFIIGGALCFILTGVILFFFRKPQPEAYLSKLLGGVLVTVGLSTVNYILIVSGMMKLIPWWYGYGIPLYPLIPPLAYLYVRGTIYRESRLKKQDYLHFIPNMVCLLAMLPFYFAGSAEKIKAVNAITQNVNYVYYYKTGLIPPIWYFICRPLQSLVYQVLQCRLVYLLAFRPGTLALKKQLNPKKITNWLVGFVLFQAVINIGVSILTVIACSNLSLQFNFIGTTKTPMVWESLLFFLFSLVLLFTPTILYGSPLTYQVEYNLDDHDDNIHKDVSPHGPGLDNQLLVMDRGAEFSQEQLDEYSRQIEGYITRSEIFRKQGLSINELAVDLKLPSRTLSQVINQHYNQRFTDYINTYRIAYFKKLVVHGDFKVLTLESLALEAGFSSRSTFFSAFKKSTGLNPTDYINSLKQEADSTVG
ncbi:helix-turn-helix domain-containing protein [Mucilaginibacter polytrichastri]|uniref:HTH araC/xylS-type domain-containing protein n=1 Tax=Mucilaginibacter polytrichastri TaxID=1302689 RepID=A0A1Q5ZUD9_9SPHI|nr:AraC family transcriptional regulator [Mucilaginibacter polytrichastri]OKS85389.1 hypothetical protein RG47T_0835 [Mucilaginibacter polytrichastri]SFS39690.1 AraC-type DNA-binding protein [Mucilaginibacter polytrichastri]